MLGGRLRLWEFALLVCIGCALASLAIAFPFSPWAADDYGSEVIAAACNFGARLNDFKLYTTSTLAYHPAVWLYLASGIASLLTLGSDAIGSNLAYFDRIMDHATSIFVMSKAVTISLTLLSMSLFRFATRSLAPAMIVWLGLAISMLATPQAPFRAVYMTTESFSLLVNVAFVATLLAAARYPEKATTYIGCGATVAFAYLLKISYIYVYLALAGSIVVSALLRREILRHALGFVAMHAIAIAIVKATGEWFIGHQAFQFLRNYQSQAMKEASSFSAGTILVSVKSALSTGSTVSLAVAGGVVTLMVALAIGMHRRATKAETVIVGLGAAAASVAATAVSLKTFNPYYELASSSTLPLLIIACWLACRHVSCLLQRTLVFSLVGIALLMAYASVGPSIGLFRTVANITLEAEADRAAILTHVDLARDRGVFLYHTPFVEHGAGYVVNLCGVPRIEAALRAANRPAQSSLGPVNLDKLRYIVVDKRYVDSKTLADGGPLDPLNKEIPRYEPGDQLYELNRVWLVVKQTR